MVCNFSPFFIDLLIPSVNNIFQTVFSTQYILLYMCVHCFYDLLQYLLSSSINISKTVARSAIFSLCGFQRHSTTFAHFKGNGTLKVSFGCHFLSVSQERYIPKKRAGLEIYSSSLTKYIGGLGYKCLTLALIVSYSYLLELQVQMLPNTYIIFDINKTNSTFVNIVHQLEFIHSSNFHVLHT
jgi:hypothetical protein